MSFRERVWPYLPEPVRYLPVDLAAVVAAVFVTSGVLLLPVINETPLRAVVSFPFLLFVPGYSFVAAVFPEAAEVREPTAPTRRRLSNLERVALSLGCSVALVPLFGFALTFTPWGFTLVPMLTTLGAFSVGCTAVAAVRRSNLPADQQFSVPVVHWYEQFKREFAPQETSADKVLNVALAVALVLATASVGYALVDQRNGEQYTELYLLTENEEGRLVTDDYPTDLTVTESRALVVGVRNHEHEATRYTVVTQLQQVSSDGGSLSVVEREELDRFGVALASNESARQTRVLTPTLTGDQLRLLFLLYRGDAPANPTEENAYRRVHLWVNVTASD